MPHRIHGGRPDAVFGDEFVEGREVTVFLIVHVFHQWAQVRVGFDDWRCLGGVDEDGG